MKPILRNSLVFIGGACVASAVWIAVLWWQRYAYYLEMTMITASDAVVAQEIYSAHQRGSPADSRKITFMCYRTVEQFVLGRDHVEELYPMFRQVMPFREEYLQAVTFLHKHNNEWKAEQGAPPLPPAPQPGPSEGAR